MGVLKVGSRGNGHCRAYLALLLDPIPMPTSQTTRTDIGTCGPGICDCARWSRFWSFAGIPAANPDTEVLPRCSLDCCAVRPMRSHWV